jgi:hypothetical protein
MDNLKMEKDMGVLIGSVVKGKNKCKSLKMVYMLEIYLYDDNDIVSFLNE